MAERLLGKVALITGGASGIGKSATVLFARHGAKVVVADVQDDLGHSLNEELGYDEKTISFIHCDVTKEIDVQNAVDLAISKYGKLDIMFNNAGLPGKYTKSVLECDKEEFKRVFDVNVFGGFLGAKHAARVMIPLKKGSIIFTSSVVSAINGDMPHAYASSKHAIVGLMKNLCGELGQFGIRVNCVSPYGVATPMSTNGMGMEESKIDELFSRAANLKGVVLKAEDVAEAALFLGSDESRYISGLNLLVDGGYSTINPAFSKVMEEEFSFS